MGAYRRPIGARRARPLLNRLSAGPAAALVCLVFVSSARAEIPDPACSDCHDVDEASFEDSVHGLFDCTDCHGGAASVPHDETGPVDCGQCHPDAVAGHRASIHGVSDVVERGNLPTCRSCHGDIHALLAASDPASPAHPSQQARICGSCHSDAKMFAGTGVHTVRPIEAYEASVHARALADDKGAASCSACHTSHAVRRTNDPLSSVYHENIPTTCGACHEEIAARFATSVHGLAAAEGVRESPVCTDCHGEHRILSPEDPGSPVFVSNLPVQTCGHCHSDVRLSEKYGLPSDKVPAYKDSYHGLALRGGRLRVANCASCHGVHDILPSSNPRSHVHSDNLAATCGHCHPGAGARFLIGPVHVDAATSKATVGYYIRLIYLPVIWLVIGAMFAHNFLDLLKKARHPHRTRATPAADLRIAERMPLGFRIPHAMVVVSFIVLVFSGFALKYPESWWASPFQWLKLDTDLRGLVHRSAGVVLMAAVASHAVHLSLSRAARRRVALLIPKFADLSELQERVAFNLGLRRVPPGQVVVGYVEKLEYWAFMWGTVITAATGLLLWFEGFTLARLPGWVPEAATALHYYEAILATLAILVWHFYWVMFDPVIYPMDTTWLTGKPPLARAEERGEIIESETDEVHPR